MLAGCKRVELPAPRESTCGPSLSYRVGVYLEEGFGLRAGVGVKAIGDLVDVVDGVGLDPHNLGAQGQVLHDGSLIGGVGELHVLIQLVEQRDIDAAEALVEGGRLVGGGHIHQVAGLGLVVQVIHSDDKPRALVNLEFPFCTRQDAVVYQATVPCRRTREVVPSRTAVGLPYSRVRGRGLPGEHCSPPVG